MQGTILILDGVSTNRIMLKVQLSAAWYHVVQGETLAGLLPMVRRVQPDLILCAMTLPDGNAAMVKAALRRDEALSSIPVIAVTAQNDQGARLRALAAGIDDVLCQPYDDVMLLARVRSLIRAQSQSEDLRQQGASQAFGFSEGPAGFDAPVAEADVAVLTQTPGTGAVWRARLKGRVPHRLHLHKIDDMHELLNTTTPDAIVVELCDSRSGLRLLPDLRARSATRNAAVIAVTNPANAHLAADALDRGADDVMSAGFEPEELALRLNTQIARKLRRDRMRDRVRDGLRAAMLDPMTGLHNRRYALPRLHGIADEAARTGQSFAVMLVDLDHFKHINDSYGHAAGDAVLVEAAHRLRTGLRPGDLIARVGGEEFMVVLPGASRGQALRIADRLCQRINGTPFLVPGHAAPVQVTTSIGVVVSPAEDAAARRPEPLRDVPRLIEQADRALYEAKGAGRNQVSMIAAAA
ncbi:response regulator receiver modulated diguanylate cyclase [Cribrihabitans marinus]|uniref:diguanylate cyclase n=1 Tax=Cribrihabitans marinus TaxID=1227549 RepID=A0A1H6U3R2_9RHOB|nr:diguanylate cyclase [Cribrihabitans marinus]SEI83040.1 response regulator receiver modulated diguanylate cyclase [Cribrihabitans marinus]